MATGEWIALGVYVWIVLLILFLSFFRGASFWKRR